MGREDLETIISSSAAEIQAVTGSGLCVGLIRGLISALRHFLAFHNLDSRLTQANAAVAHEASCFHTGALTES